LGTLNEFIHIVSISVQLELDEVFEAERLALKIDVLLGNSHQFLPVSVQNVLGVQQRNQRQDGVHVLHSVCEAHESLPRLDVLVLGGLWVALLGLHVFDQGHQLVGVDLVPSGGLPRLELVVYQGNQIPQLLQVVELVLAVLQLLVVGLLQVEQGFQVVQLLGLGLQGASLFVVVFDGNVCVINDLLVGVLHVVGAVFQES
jgi:hypothetical protein